MASALYRGVIRVGDKFVPDKFRPFWNHPAGPKTIHFWSPLAKWSLVIAGLADLGRPAEKLSVPQNAALAATGAMFSPICLPHRTQFENVIKVAFGRVTLW